MHRWERCLKYAKSSERYPCPRIHFAPDISLTKLSLGMKYIAAKLTCETYAEIQAWNTTYGSWYQGLRSTTVADVAKEPNLTSDQFTLCLILGWSLCLIWVQFGLEKSVNVKLSHTIEEMSLNEVLALMLAFGQQRFVAGPVMILAELIAECRLERFFAYLVMARGIMYELLAFVGILKKKAQGHLEHLEAMKLSFWQWIYGSLV